MAGARIELHLHLSTSSPASPPASSPQSSSNLLKTRLQQSRTTTLHDTIRALASGPSPIRQFWRGTVPSALRTGLGSALYFSSLNTLRTSLANYTSTSTSASENGKSKSSASGSALIKASPTANLVTGALARTYAGLIMSPITVLKVRYESNVYTSLYTSLPRAVAHIFRTEGVRGFFAGYGATAVRDAPYAGVYVLFYEGFKGRLGGLSEKMGRVGSVAGSSNPSDTVAVAKIPFLPAPSITILSAFLASILATTITNPFDAIKTRIQLFPSRYRHMGAAARAMVREEGLRSFFDGLGLRMARKGLSSALAWTVYEELIRRAERKWVDGQEVEGKV